MTNSSWSMRFVNFGIPRQVEHLVTAADDYYATAPRRCEATRRDGRACKAWSLRNSPAPVCASHGRHHRGPMCRGRAPSRRRRAVYPPCTCLRRWSFPHRPGSCSPPTKPATSLFMLAMSRSR